METNPNKTSTTESVASACDGEVMPHPVVQRINDDIQRWRDASERSAWLIDLIEGAERPADADVILLNERAHDTLCSLFEDYGIPYVHMYDGYEIRLAENQQEPVRWHRAA